MSAMFSENCVYGGYRDGMIFIWNLKNGEIIHNFKAHDSTVRNIDHYNNRVYVTASKDKTSCLWDSMT